MTKNFCGCIMCITSKIQYSLNKLGILIFLVYKSTIYQAQVVNLI